MSTDLEQNKQVVRRFNQEVIEQGSPEALNTLVQENVINHAAAPGGPRGRASFQWFLLDVLHNALSNISVEIHDQIAERDLVTTRKTITATHTGDLFGIAPTNQQVSIGVIDIIRVENGQYAEHWGHTNFGDILNQLRASAAL